MADKEQKYSKITIEIVDNGFIVENYGYNPYGSDLKTRNIRANVGDVINDLTIVMAHNTRLEAAARAEREKKAKEEATA